MADRGDVAFDLFKQIAEPSAFSIIRVKSNMDFVVQQSLTINLPEKGKEHLSDVKDDRIVFKGDDHQKMYRLITFEALGESYRLTTNRLDLKIHEIIMRYAYRWQIALFFRCFKRCFNGLHLWSHEARALKFNFTLTKFFVAKIMPNTIGTKHDIKHRLKNLPTLKRMES